MTNKIGVAISTWNRAKDLDRCLSLLFAQDCEFELYVVDNCSSDNTIEILEKYNTTYHVMPHSNFSAIYTINLALRVLKTEYVVILDDDTFLTDSTSLRRLAETADTDPNIAIVAANIRDHNDNISLILKTPKFDATDYNQVSNDAVYDIDDFSGACALFRRNLVGPDFYDETFKIYWNEPELAVRMVAKGHRVVINQTVKVTHGTSYVEQTPRMFYYGSRNTFRAMTKILPPKQCILFTMVLMPFHIKRFYQMRHQKRFWKFLPKITFAYIQTLYRCIFAKRIQFNNDEVKRRVYNTYSKYFVKELLILIG